MVQSIMNRVYQRSTVTVVVLATVSAIGFGQSRKTNPELILPPHKYPDVRANASKLVKLMVDQDVTATNWELEEQERFVTLRTPGHRISFYMPEKTLLSYSNYGESAKRALNRPLQADKYSEDEQWKAHAVGLAHKIWPGIPLEMADIKRTGEKQSGGQFWFEYSNRVSLILRSEKPDGK